MEGWKSSSRFIFSKALLQRPIAGSQVPFCPLGKRVPDSWSEIEPGTFRVRGVNYFRDKKKELAPTSAAYYPFGLDVFLSQRKINHIARFVELPSVNSSGKLPPILVVNVQMPLYPAAFFQGDTDGEGISFVLYFRLSESFDKDLPVHFQESIRRLIDDEVEKVKGFRADTNVPFRERLKILGRVANVDDCPMSSAERKLMHAYNEKPIFGPENCVYTSAADEIFDSGGKRMRLALVFLVSRATAEMVGLKGLTEEQRKLAEIIELIHTASLIHDDVIDECGMRRG